MRMFTRIVCILTAAIAVPTLADWPRFMGPTGDGVAPPAEKITKTFPAEGPTELWKKSMASGFGSPAIAGNKVYLLDRPGGGAKEVFTVLDLETGKEEWSVENESAAFRDNYGTTRGAPTIDGNMAYTIGVTGDVVAIDLAGKKIAWKKNIQTEYGAKFGGWGFSMSPVVLRDMLVIDTSGSKTTGIVALDKKTGEKIWASPSFGQSDTYTTPILVTLNNVEQLVAWHRGAIASVSAKDGKILWQYDWKTNRPIPNPVYLGNGRFFLTIGYGGGCAMLDVKPTDTGYDVKEVFKDNRTASKVSNAIFYKGFIYTNSSDQDQGLQCIDPDGNVKWTSKQKFGLGSMIIADDTLLMMNGDNGTLYLIEATPDAYKELAKAKVLATRDVWAPLALSNGKLLVRDQKTLKCLDITPR
jgi:outer membrane protein assembly factor BamB